VYPVIELSLGEYGNSIDTLIKLVIDQNLISKDITGNNFMINLIHFNYIVAYQKQ
jgi:hypothetical protein